MAVPRRPRPPETQSTNPFMEMFGGVGGGRYPGKGIYRGPVLGSVPEFNFDEVVDELSGAIREEFDNIGLTDNVKRLIWDDVQNAFVVSISPKKETYNLQGQPELRSDEAEISGFNPTVDLNPISWAKDPKKMMGKTAERWVRAFANWEDLSSYVELSLYNRLLDGDTREPDTTLGEKYFSALAEPVRKIYDESAVPNQRHAFQLRGVIQEVKPDGTPVPFTYKDVLDLLTDEGEKAHSIEKNTGRLISKEKRDSAIGAGAPESDYIPIKMKVGYYDDMADNFRNLVKFSKAEGTRRSNYTDFGITSLGAIGADTARVRDSINADIQTLTNQLAGATGQTAIDIRNQISRLESDVGQMNGFLSRVKVAETFKDYQGPISFLGIRGVGLGLNQARLGSRRPETINKSLAKLLLGLEEEKVVHPDGTIINVLTDKKSSVAANARKALFEVKRDAGGNPLPISRQESAKGLALGNAEEWPRTQMRLAPFEKQIAELEQIGQDIRDQLVTTDASGNLILRVDATLSKEQATFLKGKLDDMKNVTSRNGFFSGWGDRIVEQYMEEMLDPESAIRVLMEQYDSRFLAAANGVHVMEEAKKIYARESVRDALTKLEKKGVTGVVSEYVWQRIRTRLNGFTPAEHVKAWLQKHQNFGLTYDPDFAYGGSMYALSVPWVKKLFRNKIFDNNISINLREIGIGTGKLSFTGHRRFALALDLYERAKMKTGAQMHTLDMTGFFKLLNGDFSDPSAAFNISVLGNLRLPPDIFYKEMISPKLAAKMGVDQALAHAAKRRKQGMEAMSGEMRKWLIKYATELGLDVDSGKIRPTQENFDKLTKLFGKLFAMNKSSDLISILQGKAGVIQKLVSYLSRLQTIIFKYVSYIVAPYVYARNASSRWLTQKLVGTKWGKKAVESLMSKQAFKRMYSSVERKVSAIISKILGYAFTIGTEGLGLVAQWLVEHVIQAIINKVMDIAKASLSRLKNYFSVDGIDFYIEDTLTIWNKRIKACLGCSAISCMVPLFMILAILTMITPIDPTKSEAGYNTYGNAPPTGPSESCTPCCGPNTDPAICSSLPACADPIAVGECEVTSSIGCFNFVDNWPAGGVERGIIESGVQNLMNNYGCYVDKLCDGAVTITVQWSNSVACGYKSGTTLSFGDGQCWGYTPSNQYLFDNLVAHESGHIYQDTHGENDNCVDDANDFWPFGEGLMPTYASQCVTVNHDEDFAETIANYVVARCGYTPSVYPKHAVCASEIFACN